MKNSKGFTVMEGIIVVAILGIVGILIANVYAGVKSGSTMVWTPTGVVSEQCLSGYKFIVDSGGNARQVLDEFGKGVKCP